MTKHHERVDAFMAGTAHFLPTERLGAYGAAVKALRDRARLTLGDVTVNAIFARVLYVAREAHPALASLEVAADGTVTYGLGLHPVQPSAEQLDEGLRHLLLELLTVVGTLTAEILSPALHATLAGIATTDGQPPAPSPKEPRP